jgi:IS30 family transposase
MWAFTCATTARQVRENQSRLSIDIFGMTNIKEWPEEIEGRLVPGHWAGDLILGTGGASAVGTLVERTTRLVVLVHMATRKAAVAASAFAGALNTIPAPR